MSLPITASTTLVSQDNPANRVRLGAPKSSPARGTYETLSANSSTVQQANQDQNGKRLRETLAARTQDLSTTARLARANALVTQAGLPSGLNKAVDRPTSDVLAVRMQRQAFMFSALRWALHRLST